MNATPPTAAAGFPGLTAADNDTAQEPPDPWVAVNATYVVQAVNSAVRISTRNGTAIQTLPDWALFALPNDQTPSDPRIIWDTFHARWVGVVVSFNPGFTQNYLNLAISETADPLGAWDTYAIGTDGDLPDYPGLASSTDRIVLTANDFQLFGGGTGYQGLEIDIIAWSQITAGTTVTPYVFTSTTATVAHARPAQVLSSSAIVHVVYEDLTTGDVLYLKVNGSATLPVLTDAMDATFSLGIAALTLPNAPHNTDGTTIANAVDERPTDAVWRNGRLWFVATYNTGTVDGARATMLATGAATPTSAVDLLIASGGWDLYMPGVGITSDDTAFIVMTASGTGLRNPTTVASRWTAADGFYGTLPFFDTSDDTYAGTRWGDYVGVASDPALPGSVWVGDEVAAADHSWRTTVMRFAMPTISSAPTQGLVTPSTLPTVGGSSPQTVPVKIAWGGTLAGSGATFQVSQNIDGAGFESFSTSTTATSIVRSLAFGHSYQFEVRVRNAYGDISAWQVGPTFTPTLYQQTSTLTAAHVVYAGTWTSQTSPNFSGGSAKFATAASASATFVTTSVRAIGFVTTQATTRGSFKVYVDGVLKATVSAYTATTTYRRDVYAFAWPTAGNHNIKVVVVGTAGHPRVDVDAFVVLK